MLELFHFLLGLTLGALILFALIRVAQAKLFIGCIRMDSSDPEERPYLFLDLDIEPEMLATKPFVICKVDPIDISKQYEE